MTIVCSLNRAISYLFYEASSSEILSLVLDLSGDIFEFCLCFNDVFFLLFILQ